MDKRIIPFAVIACFVVVYFLFNGGEAGPEPDPVPLILEAEAVDNQGATAMDKRIIPFAVIACFVVVYFLFNGGEAGPEPDPVPLILEAARAGDLRIDNEQFTTGPEPVISTGVEVRHMLEAVVESSAVTQALDDMCAVVAARLYGDENPPAHEAFLSGCR